VNPVQELDGAGNILANLLTGLGIDEYFTRSGSTGTRTLLGDALNSTLALTDDTGTIQTTNTYVEIDLEMKRKTLQSCKKLLPAKRGPQPSWQKSPDILAWLSGP